MNTTQLEPIYLSELRRVQAQKQELLSALRNLVADFGPTPPGKVLNLDTAREILAKIY